MESKIELAIKFLKEGKSFIVEGLKLELEDNDRFLVTGWSQYLNFTNLTKTIAIQELYQIKSLFKDMLKASQKLKDFTASKLIEYRLCFDDEGKASIDICSERDRVIKWAVALK